MHVELLEDAVLQEDPGAADVHQGWCRGILDQAGKDGVVLYRQVVKQAELRDQDAALSGQEAVQAVLQACS